MNSTIILIKYSPWHASELVYAIFSYEQQCPRLLYVDGKVSMLRLKLSFSPQNSAAFLLSAIKVYNTDLTVA